MKRTLIQMAVAGVLTAMAVPAVAQNASLDQIQRELAEIRAKNERLEAEVEYLKENTKAQRKDAAKEVMDVEALKTSTSKFTWSGDFRYRNEQIESQPNSITPEHTQGRDRIRLRLGVSAKINDTITGRFQIATAGGATADPRSTNQTLGEDWSRKSIGIDQAYVDWKALSSLNILLGKMPQPWTRTAGYLWDGDLTAEGAALKFAKGPLFVNAFYDWLNERHGTGVSSPRSDTKLVGAQVGFKPVFGTSTLTVAAGYFDLTNVEGEQVSANAAAPCTVYNGTFFGNSTNGNSTYAAGGCTYLLSDFSIVNALAQFDFTAGSFPMSLFVDFQKNLDAKTNLVANETLDTAFAAGVTFNRASAPMSWEVGVIYQKAEADSVFGQFHDSDFGGGRTDTSGFVVRLGFVPAASWILNATLFINEQNNDTGAVTPATGASTIDLDYKRLQLDLNYRF
ncbi:MAG TPA: putative porin [Steroidobacteraceae bacterium]|nr:putative porin [Steroidobacteraceae bacterium]